MTKLEPDQPHFHVMTAGSVLIRFFPVMYQDKMFKKEVYNAMFVVITQLIFPYIPLKRIMVSLGIM